MVFWIVYSVSMSILAVASSMSTIFVFLNTARAILINCFSPALILVASNFASNPFLESTKLDRQH